MNYDYRVLSQGVSTFSNIEDFARELEKLLNGNQARKLMSAGYEIWKIKDFTEQGANGFLIVLRRAM